MSSKESKDWDDDENWDEWDDALEEIPTQTSTTTTTTIESNKSKTTTGTTTSTKVSNTKIIENNEITKSLTSTTNKNEENSSNTNTKSWGSSWSWGGGVVSSVFSSATEGLGNLTTTVTKGLDQVIGVPNPEEMARINALEEAARAKERQNAPEKTIETQQIITTTETSTSGASTTTTTTPTVPVLGFVTTLGTKVLNTGLDTLEGIGKKTMNILQENDPLLKNKRKMLGMESERPNLSELLQEAKNDADQIENTLKELQLEKSKENLNFEYLFEQNCGLVHLEALELLSKESNIKISALQESVSGNALTELQETINEVKELMELEDLEVESDDNYKDNELIKQLTAAMEDVDLQIQFDDIVNNWQQTLDWLTNTAPNATIEEIYEKSVTSLSETAALEMNKLHKIAELLLVKEHHSTATEVDCIVQLCKTFNGHLSGLSHHFANILAADENQEAKNLMNHLFKEMLIATEKFQMAFKLFLPIIQIGAI